MAQVKLLKINSSGLPEEMDSASDDVTLASYTVTGGGPVLDSNLDMNNGNVSDAGQLDFTDPTTDGINTTSNGVIAADDFMAIDIENTMTSAGGVTFPGGISDAAGEVDAFRLPALAGVPSASPTNGGEGHLVWDSTNDHLYAWDGAAWDNLSTVDSAEKVCNAYTADEALAAVDAVYISAADNVSKANAGADATARAIGFAEAAAIDTASVNVCSEGLLGGFAGLTPGSRYFLDTTSGLITTTAPTGGGNSVVQMGFAKSATELQIQIQFMGKKAA